MAQTLRGGFQMRSRKGRPDVHIELMLADDGRWTDAAKANPLRLEYSKTAVREIRVRVGDRIWWSLDIDNADSARVNLLADIGQQAAGLGVAFDALCAALG